MDSQVPNYVVFEALQAGRITELELPEKMRREVTYGNSRFDIYFESAEQKNFIEVKGVTLEDEGIVMFPDAPTLRGTKHVNEMIKAVEAGYGGIIFFLIQMKDVDYFRPNLKMDENFTKALTLAASKGVKLLAYDCVVHEDEITLGTSVPILL